MSNNRRLTIVALALTTVASAAAQSGVAGKWTGADQNNHAVTLELVVKGEDATGTLAVGPDPVKNVTDGKVQGATVTFTTPAMMNGREVSITWRGELKDNALMFARQMGKLQMPPVSLQRAVR